MGEMAYAVGDFVTYRFDTVLGSAQGRGEVISMDGVDEGEVLIDSGVVQSVAVENIEEEVPRETVLDS